MRHPVPVDGRIYVLEAGGPDWTSDPWPGLPARRPAARRLGRQLPLALELPKLHVAADRRSVDQDLRDGPAAGEVEQVLAERGSLSRLTSS